MKKHTIISGMDSNAYEDKKEEKSDYGTQKVSAWKQKTPSQQIFDSVSHIYRDAIPQEKHNHQEKIKRFKLTKVNSSAEQ